MDPLSFSLANEIDLQELQRWHEDPELSKWYGGPERIRETWQLTRKDPRRTLWIARNASGSVGYVDFEEHPEERLAWIGIAMAPSLRGQGLGKRIVQEFLRLPMARRYPEIWAGIEHDNSASKRCFEGAGFTTTMTEPDAEGILDYVYRE